MAREGDRGSGGQGTGKLGHPVGEAQHATDQAWEASNDMMASRESVTKALAEAQQRCAELEGKIKI